ncbi:hypothetical protein Pst134EA_000317 [Puccinia striiformis f. sp. tritici]|uniref:hypothetical protein n=1 Tax=Puccinia striiformis f. sp. tritici TaxID=168172 RepID=UPI002007CF40|nr:hypothetical protein Pst134EA_000317 [Puccinia striiformis f. sp. tritici]KAH9473243.1 hypothetical protein Pst134EA_000317 [Puccinia striiformis f. sp. tritici]
MDEEKYVEEAITKIRKNNPNPAGDIPFSTLKSILNASHTSVTTPLQESVAAASKVANPLDFGLLDSDLANLDDEDLVTTQVAETVQNDIYERPEEIAVESLPPSQNPPTQIRLKIKPIKKIPTPEEPFQSNSFLPKGPPNDMLPVAPKDVLPVLPKPKKFRPTKKVRLDDVQPVQSQSDLPTSDKPVEPPKPPSSLPPVLMRPKSCKEPDAPVKAPPPSLVRRSSRRNKGK